MPRLPIPLRWASMSLRSTRSNFWSPALSLSLLSSFASFSRFRSIRSQFVLITPQGMQNYEGTEGVYITKMNDPVRSESSLLQSSWTLVLKTSAIRFNTDILFDPLLPFSFPPSLFSQTKLLWTKNNRSSRFLSFLQNSNHRGSSSRWNTKKKKNEYCFCSLSSPIQQITSSLLFVTIFSSLLLLLASFLLGTLLLSLFFCLFRF